MGAPSRAVLAMLALLLAGAARADDVSDFLKNSGNSTRIAEPEAKELPIPPPPSCTEGIAPKRRGAFCDNFDDCVKFCSCACKFDEHKWPAPVKGVTDDGSTTCGASMPDTGFGMLSPDSPDLHPVPNLAYIAVAPGAKATQETIDGLRRLSEGLSVSKNRAKHRFTVRLGSCYRPHRVDSVPECGYILKGKFMLAKTDIDDAMRKYWEEKSNPMNLGLTWPGITPHSGGYACDLILVDEHGQDCFDWRAGVKDAPACSIPQRLASSLMDDEATSPDVGAKRLRYEAWHYEFGPSASGCVSPNCAANYWPLTGKP
jgi:hypothetical protein